MAKEPFGHKNVMRGRNQYTNFAKLICEQYRVRESAVQLLQRDAERILEGKIKKAEYEEIRKKVYERGAERIREPSKEEVLDYIMAEIDTNTYILNAIDRAKEITMADVEDELVAEKAMEAIWWRAESQGTVPNYLIDYPLELPEIDMQRRTREFYKNILREMRLYPWSIDIKSRKLKLEQL